MATPYVQGREEWEADLQERIDAMEERRILDEILADEARDVPDDSWNCRKE